MGKLPTRLHVLSNELPKLGDASAAIVGRMVLPLTTQSWLGREDYALEPTLHTELPGILNWAMDGLQRLTVTNDNIFTRLASADEAITLMRDLASPVAAFVREQCTRCGSTIYTPGSSNVPKITAIPKSLNKHLAVICGPLSLRSR